MELRDKVAEWLTADRAERDFNAGVALFSYLTGYYQLKKIFALKGDNTYNRDKLNNELERFHRSGRSVTIPGNAFPQSAPAVGNHKYDDSLDAALKTQAALKSVPGAAEKLKNTGEAAAQSTGALTVAMDVAREMENMEKERKGRFLRATYLHDRLDLITDDGERHAACLEIYWQFQRINQIHRIIDHYKETGEFLKEPALGQKEPKKEEPANYTSMDLADLQTAQRNLRSRKSKAKGNPEKLAEVSAELAIVDKLVSEKKAQKTVQNIPEK